MKLVKKIIALLVMVGFLFPATANAADTPAQAVVRNFYAQLMSVMKQGEMLGFSGRYKKLDPAIRAAFNLPLMAKTAVGSSWSEASPEEQNELIEAFSDFSIANYAGRFTSYGGEQFVVQDEKPQPGGVIVDTTLKLIGGEPVALNYLLRPDDKGKYRIVDIYLNGTISELATRHSEFSSIARRDGIPALVNSLDEKSKQMGPG